MQIVVILYYLGINDKAGESVHAQYRHNHCRPSYILPVSNGVAFLSNIFNPRLVELTDVKPAAMEG